MYMYSMTILVKTRSKDADALSIIISALHSSCCVCLTSTQPNYLLASFFSMVKTSTHVLYCVSQMLFMSPHHVHMVT